jgi:PilZ domain
MPEARQYSYVSKSDYAPCTLRDLSMEGVGVQVADGSVEIGDRVVLDLPLGQRQRASIQLTGEVRHAAPDQNGVVMAGIQFVDVGALERALLYRLLRDLEPRARQTA